MSLVKDDKKHQDSFAILEIMRQVTRLEPKMWGTSIIGFGSYHYYESGHEGDICLAGFSSRKQSITLYLTPELDNLKSLLKDPGKHKTGKGCLYINKIEDVNINVLKQLIKATVEAIKKKYS